MVEREWQQIPALPLIGCINSRGTLNLSELASSVSVKVGLVMVIRGRAMSVLYLISQETAMDWLIGYLYCVRC